VHDRGAVERIEWLDIFGGRFKNIGKDPKATPV